MAKRHSAEQWEQWISEQQKVSSECAGLLRLGGRVAKAFYGGKENWPRSHLSSPTMCVHYLCR